MDKQEALRILEEIEENINVCCAITMDPDEVLVLIDKIKSYINGTIRRKIHEELEVVKEGFANGVAPGFPLDTLQKQHMIEDAAEAFGKFLTALKCDWKNDPNSAGNT